MTWRLRWLVQVEKHRWSGNIPSPSPILEVVQVMAELADVGPKYQSFAVIGQILRELEA